MCTKKSRMGRGVPEGEEEDTEGEEEDEYVSEAEVTEASAAGWRAKTQMTDKRKKRGFEPAPRGSPMARTGQPQSQQSDSRKAKSRCAGCGQL